MLNRLFKGFLVISLILTVYTVASKEARAAYVSISPSGNTLSISVSGANYGETVDLIYTLPGSSKIGRAHV